MPRGLHAAPPTLGLSPRRRTPPQPSPAAASQNAAHVFCNLLKLLNFTSDINISWSIYPICHNINQSPIFDMYPCESRPV